MAVLTPRTSAGFQEHPVIALHARAIAHKWPHLRPQSVRGEGGATHRPAHGVACRRLASAACIRAAGARVRILAVMCEKIRRAPSRGTHLGRTTEPENNRFPIHHRREARLTPVPMRKGREGKHQDSGRTNKGGGPIGRAHAAQTWSLARRSLRIG